MDLSAAAEGDEDHSPTQSAQESQRMFAELGALPVPTVCLLNGPAMGGGVGLFFCCDLRISTSPDHYLALTECRRGLVPALISPWIVRELGKTAVMEMMLGGGRVSAGRLWELGVISCCLSDQSEKQLMQMPPLSSDAGELKPFKSIENVLDHYAKMFAQAGPGANKTIKHLIRRLGVEGRQWEEKDLPDVLSVFEGMISTDEAGYGMECFLQRKRPQWQSLCNNQKSKL
jgi:methylglutaconyl-CoA hydratase